MDFTDWMIFKMILFFIGALIVGYIKGRYWR